MDTIFMNSKNSKTSDRLIHNVLYKTNIKRNDKCLIKSQYLLCMEKKKKLHKNNKFKISTPTWNYKFRLPEGSYSVLNIQEYFGYIIKQYETLTDNPSIRIYINKIKSRITFDTTTGYYLEFLTPTTMKLLAILKIK